MSEQPIKGRKRPKAYVEALERLAKREQGFVERVVDQGMSPGMAARAASGTHNTGIAERILTNPDVAKAAILGLQAKNVTFQELFGLAKHALYDAMQVHQPIPTRLAGARATLEALKRTGEEISLSDVARAEDAASLTQLAEAILGSKKGSVILDVEPVAEAGPPN